MPLCLVHKYLYYNILLGFSVECGSVFLSFLLCFRLNSIFEILKLLHMLSSWFHFLEIPFSILLPEVVSILDAMVCFLGTTKGLILFSNPVS